MNKSQYIGITENRVKHMLSVARKCYQLAKEKYNMSDEICKAVMSHTIANDNMSTLDKILFVADKIEPGKVYPGIEEERIIAKEDLDKAMLLCLENNYKKLTSKGKTMYPSTLKLLKQLKKNK